MNALGGIYLVQNNETDGLIDRRASCASGFMFCQIASDNL